jgi:hypothetical protein
MNPSKRYRSLWLTGTLLMLAALACNAPGMTTPTQVPPAPTVPQVIEASPTPPQAAEASPTSPPSTSATATPAPDVSGPGGCTLNAAYVADVTIPDNTELAPGKAFTKVWRVGNSGTCAWGAGTQLVFASGEPMGGPAAVGVPSVAPGSNTDISVNLSAPAVPGTYRSTWQLQDPDGTRFGSQVYVQIVVPGPATATPTPTVTPTPPAAPPDLVITDLKVEPSDPRQGLPVHIVATLRNQGAATAQNFHWAWRVCVHDGCPYTEAPGAFTLQPGEAIVAQMEYLFQGWATYTTEAWVDSRAETAESNETNNTRQLVIEVKPGLPDLVISAINFDPDPPTQGQDATIKVKVHNQGSQPTGAFTVEWWASINAPTPACQWTVSGGLEADAKVKLECTYAYPSWYSKITTRAIADASGTIAELNETNNTMDMETPVNKP